MEFIIFHIYHSGILWKMQIQFYAAAPGAAKAQGAAGRIEFQARSGSKCDSPVSK